MQYRHTQIGPLHRILLAVVALFLIGAWLGRHVPQASAALLLSASLVLILSFAFARLIVEDAGEELVVYFGPLPLFRKRIPYARIGSFEPDRTRWIDGWGIHWLPGRGTTWNLWGFDCVKLIVNGRVLRIGTDDVEGLMALLYEKIAAR